MQAVILAAGLGNRLRPLTAQTPKCLIEVNGTPIICNALDALSERGVERVVIVLGHLATAVRQRLGEVWRGMQLVYVENPDFASTNNVYSLWTARGCFDRDTILMECDVFFEPAVLDRLLEHRQDNVALVDTFAPFMDGTVVQVDRGGLISKMIPARDQGEEFSFRDTFKTVNIYFFRQKFLADVFLPNLDLYVKTQRNDQFYEILLTVLIYMGQHKIRAAQVEGARWLEIDDHADLARAQYLFSPPLERYRHVDAMYGGYWRYDFVDFAYLYNLHFPPTPLVNELKLNLPSLLGNYPSGQRELCRLLAPWTGLPAAFLAVGNGASELINVLKSALVKKLAIPAPCFNEYAAHLPPDAVQRFNYSPQDFTLDLNAYARGILEAGCNVAVLVNPNNPTATFHEKDDVERWVAQLASLDAVIVDESFIDFAATPGTATLEPLLAKYPNLIVLKSLSKNLGIPGLRLGYAASANAALVSTLREGLAIWNVNALAEHFLDVVTKYRAEFRVSCERMAEERTAFLAKLRGVAGLQVFEARANFVLCRLPPGVRATELKQRLFVEDNLLIKDLTGKPGLEGGEYIRLAVRRESESERLVDALHRILGKNAP